MYGWGRGEHGRLGFGDDKSSKMVPQRVQLLVGEEIVQVFQISLSLQILPLQIPINLYYQDGLMELYDLRENKSSDSINVLILCRFLVVGHILLH